IAVACVVAVILSVAKDPAGVRTATTFQPFSLQISPFPTARRTTENKVEKSGMFLASKKVTSKHHVSPRIHHVLTIKKPRSTTRFFQTPSKTPAKTRKSHAVTSAGFFLKFFKN